MRILIVEDEKVSQQKMKVIMQQYGFCDLVANGAHALEMFEIAWKEKTPYDLITLDITLHEMSGLDVLLKVREFEENANIPKAMQTKVMMVSAHSDHDNVSTSVTIGANGYVVKPFTVESISESMRKIYIKFIEDNF